MGTKSTASTKPFIQYARVSRYGRRKKSDTITVPEQVRTMRELASSEGVELYPDVYEDGNRSGGNLDRTEFQRAIAMVESGEAGGIVVAKLDRFSRDTADFLAVLGQVEAAGGRLICGDGNVSLQSGSDAFTATVRVAAATFERTQRKEDMQRSVRNAIDRGVHLACPFGYRRNLLNGHKTNEDLDGRALVPDEREAPIVVQMFEMRADGHSWHAIAAKLNEGNVMPRPYRRHEQVIESRWRGNSINAMVSNETYLGHAYSGEHRHENAHLPLVSRELFARANRMKGTKPNKPEEGYLLTGLCRCATCGYVMVHTRNNGVRYYQCSGKSGQGQCAERAYANAEQIEALALSTFKAEFVALVAEGHALDSDVADHADVLKVKQDDLRNVMSARARLGDMTGAEAEVANELVDEARLAVRHAEQALLKARHRARGVDLPHDLNEDTIDNAPIPDARHLLASVYAAFVVSPARRWREPASERTRILGRDESPDNNIALIGFVRGLAAVVA
jgi:DNA invertase Pin-like site-specific DNA recombinase